MRYQKKAIDRIFDLLQENGVPDLGTEALRQRDELQMTTKEFKEGQYENALNNRSE